MAPRAGLPWECREMRKRGRGPGHICGRAVHGPQHRFSLEDVNGLRDNPEGVKESGKKCTVMGVSRNGQNRRRKKKKPEGAGARRLSLCV